MMRLRRKMCGLFMVAGALINGTALECIVNVDPGSGTIFVDRYDQPDYYYDDCFFGCGVPVYCDEWGYCY